MMQSTQQSVQAGAWAAIALAALCLCPAGHAAGGSLRLQKDGEDLYLARGSSRLLIESKGRWVPSCLGARDVRLPGGATVRLQGDEVVVARGTKRLARFAVGDLLQSWIEDDALWGGHSAGNETRYMHRSAGGISGTVSSGVPAGRDALAVVTWRANGPSGEPVFAQHLVRIRVAPKPAVEPLRALDVPGDWGYALSSCPPVRLFRAGGRLLLTTKLAPGMEYAGARPLPPAELVEITPAGKTLRVVATWPARLYPAGLLDGRWIVLGQSDEKAPKPLWTYDLRLRKLAVLPGDWQGYFAADYLYVPETGGRILILKTKRLSQTELAHTTYVVSVPSGGRVALPNPTGSVMHYLWQGLAVIKGGDNTVRVYDAGTGRPVASLKMPGARAQ